MSRSKIIKLRERRQKKLNNVKAYRRKRVVIITALIIGFVTGVWLIYSSDFFSITEIRVKGNKNITDQKIIEKSGIKRNTSLITLPSVRIANRLKEVNWVQRAVVLRDWPDTVILQIIERKPVVYIQTDESTYLIDKKGFVIDKQANVLTSYSLPKIDGLSLKKVKIGTYIKNKTLGNALVAYLSLDTDLQKDVFSMTANSPEELYFIARGVEIIYGEAKNTKLKNKVIKTIFKQNKENISSIDVRIPDKPVVRIIGR